MPGLFDCTRVVRVGRTNNGNVRIELGDTPVDRVARDELFTGLAELLELYTGVDAPPTRRKEYDDDQQKPIRL